MSEGAPKRPPVVPRRLADREIDKEVRPTHPCRRRAGICPPPWKPVQGGTPGPTRAPHPPAPHAPSSEACAQASELGLPANLVCAQAKSSRAQAEPACDWYAGALRASEIRLRASQIGLRLVSRCLARKPDPVARKAVSLARKPRRSAFGPIWSAPGAPRLARKGPGLARASFGTLRQAPGQVRSHLFAGPGDPSLRPGVPLNPAMFPDARLSRSSTCGRR